VSGEPRGLVVAEAQGPLEAAQEYQPKEVSEARRAHILKLFVIGFNRGQIARKLRIEKAVVEREVQRAERAGKLPKARERMAGVLKSMVEDALLVKGKGVQKLSTKDIGILFDKMQLLEGQATGIIEVKRDREDIVSVIAKLKALAQGSIEVEAEVVG
jgi:hypothetical protein